MIPDRIRGSSFLSANKSVNKLPTSIPTTLKKLESVSTDNRVILKDFYEHMLSKDHKSEHHITNLLLLLVSLDKFYNIPFTPIDSKDQILKFLNHRQVEGKWIERERDSEGRYITSFNSYLRLLSIFFKWLLNGKRDKS